MITKSLKPLILGIIALTIMLIFAQFFRDSLVFHRSSIEQGEWWLTLTGNFVHSNYPHLILNLAGIWIFGFLFSENLSIKTLIISVLVLCATVGIGLYSFNPELEKYYGFSGALYGLFLIGAIIAFLTKDWFTAFFVAFFIIGKITWDLIYGGSTSSEELIGVPVAVHAHFYGAIGAVIVGVGIITNHLRTKI